MRIGNGTRADACGRRAAVSSLDRRQTYGEPFADPDAWSETASSCDPFNKFLTIQTNVDSPRSGPASNLDVASRRSRSAPRHGRGTACRLEVIRSIHGYAMDLLDLPATPSRMRVAGDAAG